MTGGIALGPVVSGLLLEHFWWGSVFLINLPAMALLLVLGPFLRAGVPDRRGPAASTCSASRSRSVPSCPSIYGIKELGPPRLRAAPRALRPRRARRLGALFVRRQRRADPMIDPGCSAGAPSAARRRPTSPRSP